MTTFLYENAFYDFDSEQCYCKNSLVRLPDGTILAVQGWLESCPPKPHGFKVQTYLPGCEPETTPATRNEFLKVKQ